MVGACPTKTIGSWLRWQERINVDEGVLAGFAAVVPDVAVAVEVAQHRVTSATIAIRRGTGQPTAARNLCQRAVKSAKVSASTAANKVTSAWTVQMRSVRRVVVDAHTHEGVHHLVVGRDQGPIPNLDRRLNVATTIVAHPLQLSDAQTRVMEVQASHGQTSLVARKARAGHVSAGTRGLCLHLRLRIRRDL